MLFRSTNNQSQYVKENKPQQLISLYTYGLKGILVKRHLIKLVKWIKRVPYVEHQLNLFIKRVSHVNPNMT